jgi:phosphate/sulfate permease
MKRLIVLVTLVVVIAGLLLSGDSLATTADTNVPNDEITNSTNHSATLTITMITPPLPDE